MKLIERKKQLERLISWKDKDLIKVITGIRRCGKSTLLKLYQEKLLSCGVAQNQIHAINFEHPDWLAVASWQEVLEHFKPYLKKERKLYIFLDEIQRLPSFEILVDGLYACKNVDLYITGSNAFLLSGELATYLSGRYVELHLSPFSFEEFYYASTYEESIGRCYTRYLQTSGFPYALELRESALIDDYLTSLFNTILLKDVVARYNFRDVALLERITRFLFDNIGNPTSIAKICNSLTSTGMRTNAQTVENYIRALCDVFVLHQVRRYDIKGKAWLKTNAKYYLEDVGLRRILLGTRTGDLGHLLENVVYLELSRRYREISVGILGNQEIDFVAVNGDAITYYQVALTVREEATLKRELAPLRALSDAYPKILLTLDDDPEISHEGIRQINVLDWLLGQA